MKQYDSLYVVLGALSPVAGMLLGIVLGIRQDFQLAPVDAILPWPSLGRSWCFLALYCFW
jgi:hypothetical protein